MQAMIERAGRPATRTEPLATAPTASVCSGSSKPTGSPAVTGPVAQAEASPQT